MSASLNPDTLIVMAYARLKGLRDNVPGKGVAPDTMFHDFNRALEDLKQAGHDLSAFQITGNDLAETAYGSRHVEQQFSRRALTPCSPTSRSTRRASASRLRGPSDRRPCRRG